MSSVILSDNGVSSGSAGIKTSADSSGQLQLQTTTSGGVATTAISIDNNQAVTIQGLTVGKGAGAAAYNTVLGSGALAANSTGNAVTAIGYGALALSTANYNTAVGRLALTATTTGVSNTAVGANIMSSNTTGAYNTALGDAALYSNTTASYNTAVGYQSGYSNTTGQTTTAFGYKALYSNTTSDGNTAVGYQAGLNTTGASNTALGSLALFSNTTSSNNTAVGYQAGYSQTTSSQGNVLVGVAAGYSNVTGGRNVCIGLNAGVGVASNSYDGNVFIGHSAGASITTGSNNTFVGSRGTASGGGAGFEVTTGSKNTIVGQYSGNQGGLDIRTASNYIVLSDGDGNPRGWFADDGVFTVRSTVSGGTGMTLNNSVAATWIPIRFQYQGSLVGYVQSSSTTTTYVTSSDYRLKDNVAPMTGALAKIAALKPCTYTWKVDGSEGQGFIAHELAEVCPQAVTGEKDAVDEEGNPEYQGIDTSFLVATLTAAIQELNAKVEAQAAEIAALKGQA